MGRFFKMGLCEKNEFMWIKNIISGGMSLNSSIVVSGLVVSIINGRSLFSDQVGDM